MKKLVFINHTTHTILEKMDTEIRSKGWEVQVKKALVTLAIEKTITEKFGKSIFETVSKRLFDKYHCYMPDCYENSECLHRVLEDLFGDSYLTIAKSIWDEVGYRLLILPKFNDEEFIHYQMNYVDSSGEKKTKNGCMTSLSSQTIKELELMPFVN